MSTEHIEPTSEHTSQTDAFMRLYDTAWETCLVRPQTERQDSELPTKSRRRQLGAWSARRAFSIVRGIKPDEFSPAMFVAHEFAFSNESAADLVPNPIIQEKITRFGEALLEEAFECLGDDADEMVQKFIDGSTNEQFGILNWLVGRIHAIRSRYHKSTEDRSDVESSADQTDEEDDTFYHPIRLSPKIIGKYPDTKVEPTCLSYSILVASFFEKAGAKYLHGGVVATAREELQKAHLIMLGQCSRLILDEGLPAIQIIDDILALSIEKALENYSHFRGYHADVIVKVGDRWVQIDPNYNNNTSLRYDDSLELDATYQHLEAVNSLMAGVEHIAINRYDNFFYAILVAYRKQKDRELSIDDIDEFLADIDPAELFSELHQKLFIELFESDELRYAFSVAETYGAASEGQYDKFMQGIIDDVIYKYVLYAEPETVVNRIPTDAAFRRRLAENLFLAPRITLLSFSSILIERLLKIPNIPHSAHEVGLPAYRIGAAVLSDFSVYTGDELPPSFWLSHWASQVSLTEHPYPRDELDIDPDELAARAVALRVVDDEPSHYLSLDAINDLSRDRSKGGDN